MTRDEIIARNPILTFLQSYGLEFKKKGGEHYAVCPFHGDKSPSFRVNETKQTWFCDPCGIGGSVIDFVVKRHGLDVKGALQRLSGELEARGARGAGPVKESLVCSYPYTDANGKLLFEVCRFVPKTFRQRHKGPDGAWVYNMQGVTRVLYRLPEITAAADVIVCEGEKDCDSLAKLGFPATCNSMGAGKWLESYSDTLKGKTVFVIPDNDAPGRAHADAVIASISGKAKRIFEITVPGPTKDITDFILQHGAAAKDEVLKLINGAKRFLPAVNVPIKSMAELEVEYSDFTKRAESVSYSFDWLPSLRVCVRPLVPGELVVILADTGVGKTAILQNIARNAKMFTLMFELELPGTLMFERFVQMESGKHGEDVFDSYRAGAPVPWDRAQLQHVFVCEKSRMKADEMQRIIQQAEMKIGEPPGLFLVDYLGLMEGKGTSRYERISDLAEQMKIIAKDTNTIGFLASQISRSAGDSDDGEINLHAAKDSGSIENSAGLVLGAWRSGKNGEFINIKILKNTKGRAGKVIVCDFKGVSMQIQQAPLDKQPQN